MQKTLFATLLLDYRFLTQESLDVLGTRKLNVEFNFMEHGQVKLFSQKDSVIFIATIAFYCEQTFPKQRDAGRYRITATGAFEDLAVQNDQHNNALIPEYYDGFRTTSFKRKVRPLHCLQS